MVLGSPVTNPRSSLNVGNVVSATAACTAAKPKVLGGGYNLTTTGPVGDLALLNPTGSYPSDAGTWTAHVTVSHALPNGGGNLTITLQTYAICSS